MLKRPSAIRSVAAEIRETVRVMARTKGNHQSTEMAITPPAAHSQEPNSKKSPPADSVSDTMVIRRPRGMPGPRMGFPWINQ